MLEGAPDEFLGEPVTILHFEVKTVEMSDGMNVGSFYRGFAIVKKQDGTMLCTDVGHLIMKEWDSLANSTK